MSLSGGTLSSGTFSRLSHGIRSFGSEGKIELQARMDLKRKRRKESNRESAKRSRLRKQQHLDELTSQVKLTQKCKPRKERALELQELLKQTPIMHGALFSRDPTNFFVNQLRMKNQQLVTTLNLTVQSYTTAEAQNSVLRTQAMELESRLRALREIILYMNNANTQFASPADPTATYYPTSMMTSTTATAAGYDVFGANAWGSGMQMTQQQQHIDLLYQC